MNATDYIFNITNNFVMGVSQEISIRDAFKNICNSFSDKFILYGVIIAVLLITKEFVYFKIINRFVKDTVFSFEGYTYCVDIICIALAIWISFYAFVWIK